jgi:large subunit ribosomal protein L25
MATETTALTVTSRPVEGSRSTRRLRRAGLVPGVVYGGGADPIPFQVDARELRQALAHAGAVISLTLDGEQTPVVLKEQQRHPVNGATLHVDLLRVDLLQKITTTVVLELTGVEDAPGVKAGGVLEQVTRELNIEALPTEIPDVITHDVSSAEIGDTITLEAVAGSVGVTVLDDPETVIATCTPPRLSVEPSDEIEQETELVGEGDAAAEDESSDGSE